MRRALVLLGTLALAAACSSSSSMTSTTPTASPAVISPSPTGPPDPFTAITPPTSPGIGSYDATTANEAYGAAQSLIAEQLFERTTLVGQDDKKLGVELAGTFKYAAVLNALPGGVAKPAGLDLRPRFAAGVVIPAGGFVTVLSSDYEADQVGQSPQTAIRVVWNGSVRYALTDKGKPFTVTFTMRTGYLFEPSSDGTSLPTLVGIAIGSSQITPEPARCRAMGVICPV